MAGDFSMRVVGLDELKQALRSISPKLRRQALRNALAAGARIVRDEAKRATPVLSAPVVRGGRIVRKPGTVRDAIRVRTSKQARRSGDVGVFVNVKPAKGAVFRGGVQVRAKERGANSPNDPFYWRFLEFGRSARGSSGARERVQRVKRGGIEVVKGVRARRTQAGVGALPPYRMLQKGAARLPEALRLFERTLGPAIQRLNTKGAR